MKRFTFNLQKVLDLRNFEMEQAELELGKANAEVNRIQKQLDAVASQRVNVSKQIEGTKDFTLYSNANQYFRFLDKKKEQFLEEIAQANLVADEKREVLKEKMQKVKVLEKLKEKKITEWKKESLKEEELSMDDVVTAKYNQKN